MLWWVCVCVVMLVRCCSIFYRSRLSPMAYSPIVQSHQPSSTHQKHTHTRTVHRRTPYESKCNAFVFRSVSVPPYIANICRCWIVFPFTSSEYTAISTKLGMRNIVFGFGFFLHIAWVLGG